MKIGIAHFTDIHFTTKTDIDNKLGSCLNAIKNDFSSVQSIYFILSGDIASSGIKVEYDLAKIFFNKIKQLIEKQYFPLKVKMIIVPGNHDCYLPEPEPQIRKNSIENVSYSTLGDDNTVVDICLSAQKDFWDFYGNYNDIPEDKLFYNITDDMEGCSVCFHCINTAWMSQRQEKAGRLFFPVKRYDSYSNDGCYLNIGVWHHPYNWFNPSTFENNKKEFQHFTERLASVHFLGHEHEDEFYTSKNQKTGDKINLLSGKVFNEDSKPNVSGFETVVVDLEDRDGHLKTYTWSKSFFNSDEAKKISFFKDIYKKFKSNVEFLKSLDEIKIPLVIGDRRKVKLNEIFVFPDLDSINSETKVLEDYQDSENILDNKYGHSVITGEDQIGKSSLLQVIYVRKLQEGVYPILITGKEIKDLEFEKVLKRAFKKQYENGDENFESYLQLDKSKKILLIDDYHNCKIAPAKIYTVLKEFMSKFDFVILTIDSAHSLLPIIQTEFKDTGFYKIKPLGFSKRNELVTQYYNLKRNNFQYNDDIREITELFDKVGSVLGDKLIPSYPIFILSILQALDYNSLGQNETSFGYCYQTLIHFSLHKARVRNEDIDTYFNFLSELAYELVKNDKDVLTESELLFFFTEYKKRFITPAYSIIIETLKQSKILIIEDDIISFGYEYILYYLSAKKISDIIHTKEGQKIITKLFKNLQDEKNGNILVFVTHHSKDFSFIQESLLNSMVILEEFSPITLALNDPFYSEIKAIADDLSKEILEINRNPKEERSKQLKKLDKEEKENEELTNTETQESLNEIILPFKQAFRSIEIIGQIIRNRKGSLEISQLKDMIKEVYITGFRTIKYNSELLTAAKSQIITMINDEEADDADKREIEDSVTKFIMMSSVESCIGVFGKIIQSLGLKDLKSLFVDIGNELDTPAAKLVSFGVNSYYSNISENDLKVLVNDLKGNPVALKMLRARVQSYVYSRNLDIRTKQKFASLLDMTVYPSRPIRLS